MNLTFIGQVYGNLILQCAIALSVAKNPTVEESVRRNMLAYVLGSIGLILALAFAKASQPVRFLLLTMFSAISGALMSTNKPSSELLQEVLTIFVTLVAVGATTALLGFDLRTMYIFLFVALLALIIMRAFSGLKLSQVGAFIFGLFVIADTNAIMQKNYNGDVVQATLDYFLDFINLLSFVGDENS